MTIVYFLLFCLGLCLTGLFTIFLFTDYLKLSFIWLLPMIASTAFALWIFSVGYPTDWHQVGGIMELIAIGGYVALITTIIRADRPPRK